MDRRTLITKAPATAGAVLLGATAVEVATAEPAQAAWNLGEQTYRLHDAHDRRVYLQVSIVYRSDTLRLTAAALWWGKRFAGGDDWRWYATNFSCRCLIRLWRGANISRWSRRDDSGQDSYDWNTRWRDRGGSNWRAQVTDIHYGIGGHWHTESSKWSEWVYA